MLLSAARDSAKRTMKCTLLASNSSSPSTLLRFYSSSTSSTSPVLRVASFGQTLVPYSEAMRLQDAIAEARKTGALKTDVALSLQHASVYTLGKRARASADLLSSPAAVAARASAEVSPTPRGGQATWHGPGQAVLYPVLLLKGNSRIGVRKYMQELEATLVSVSTGLGVQGARSGCRFGAPGAWVDVPFENQPSSSAQHQSFKIGAIGVRVSGGVATHGAALNVSPDLKAFDAIVPCGNEEALPTSVAVELARKHERLRELAPPYEEIELDVAKIGLELAEELARRLKYEKVESVEVGELKEELSRLGF